MIGRQALQADTEVGEGQASGVLGGRRDRSAQHLMRLLGAWAINVEPENT
jgi:hypothetical protein